MKKNWKNFLKLLICGKKRISSLALIHEIFPHSVLLQLKNFFDCFFLYTIVAQYLIKIRSNEPKNEKSSLFFIGF
jgi:hypothetical protein